MEDDELVQLLREIRDIQKSHFENQKLAIEHQLESMRVQRIAARTQRTALLVILVAVIALIAWVHFSGH